MHDIILYKSTVDNNISIRFMLMLIPIYNLIISASVWGMHMEATVCGPFLPIFIPECDLSIWEHDSLISHSDYVLPSLKPCPHIQIVPACA